MTMSSVSKSLKDNGSLPPPLESWSTTPAPHCPTPSVTFVQILVTMGSSALCTPVLQAVGNQHQVMQHIIVWQPNVISVIDGDTQTRSAIFRSVEDAMPQGMWLITAQSIHLPNPKLTILMEELILTTTTSTPLWMTTRELMCIKPGAQMYEGGNVTISFLTHVFFLISVVRHPYFSFAPFYKETNHYLLAFLTYSSPLMLPL